MDKIKKAYSFFSKIGLLVEFFKDKNVSLAKKIKISLTLGFGILYFVSPLDIVPDIIFGVGIVDDGFVIVYVLSTVIDELVKYEESKSNTINSVEYTIEEEK